MVASPEQQAHRAIRQGCVEGTWWLLGSGPERLRNHVFVCWRMWAERDDSLSPLRRDGPAASLASALPAALAVAPRGHRRGRAPLRVVARGRESGDLRRIPDRFNSSPKQYKASHVPIPARSTTSRKTILRQLVLRGMQSVLRGMQSVLRGQTVLRGRRRKNCGRSTVFRENCDS